MNAETFKAMTAGADTLRDIFREANADKQSACLLIMVTPDEDPADPGRNKAYGSFQGDETIATQGIAAIMQNKPEFAASIIAATFEFMGLDVASAELVLNAISNIKAGAQDLDRSRPGMIRNALRVLDEVYGAATEDEPSEERPEFIKALRVACLELRKELDAFAGTMGELRDAIRNAGMDPDKMYEGA